MFAGILWDPWDFSNQISSNPMESYETQGILAIKSHQTQWNLLGSIRFQQSNLINPMESFGAHRILAITFRQPQWNLMGPMRF
jgi:hypothetical protein